MNRLEAGKIINTHGLRGEVKVSTWTNYPEDFEDISFVYVKRKTGEERLDIKGIKFGAVAHALGKLLLRKAQFLAAQAQAGG